MGPPALAAVPHAPGVIMIGTVYIGYIGLNLCQPLLSHQSSSSLCI